MYRPRPCCVRKLSDRISDPKPSRRPGAVTIRRKFVGVFGAFLHRLLAVARKHEVGDAPYVDFGITRKVIRWPYIDG